MIKSKMCIDESLKNITATLVFEGLQPSKIALDMCRQLLEGKISGTEAREAIFNHYNIKSKSKV